MIKKLLELIDHVTRHNGPTPLEIICNRRTLRMLAHEDLEHRVDRVVEVSYDTSTFATYRFCGIPIHVVNDEAIEDGKFAVVANRQPTMAWHTVLDYDGKGLIGKYKTDTEDRFWEFPPYEEEDYERLYDLAVANIRKKGREEPQDIDDAKLLSILNGGGFNAVA